MASEKVEAWKDAAGKLWPSEVDADHSDRWAAAEALMNGFLEDNPKPAPSDVLNHIITDAGNREIYVALLVTAGALARKYAV